MALWIAAAKSSPMGAGPNRTCMMSQSGSGEGDNRSGTDRVEGATPPADRPMRTLLLGTAGSVRQLMHLMALVDPPRDIIGCVLPATASHEQLPASVTVLGHFDALGEVLLRYGIEQVLVSLPAAAEPQARAVLTAIERQKVAWRWMPTLTDQLAGDVRPPFAFRSALPPGGEEAALDFRQSRGRYGQIDPAALLGRRPRPLDEELIGRTVGGKVVLVTGAGGSIGSELVRMLCRFKPAKVVLVERAESPLFEIERELISDHRGVPHAAELLDITNRERTLEVFTRHRPDLVFHAAALKHVGLMQDRPAEAIESNFFGTRWVADAAAAAGTRRMVMISTDKAVNPASVMGSTKRLAEFYVQHLNETTAMTLCIVRFGNVLGSVGSVLPIWSKQLAAGVPLTVTHQDMHRYFMTIPEAAGLVLQSAAMSGRKWEDLSPDASRGGEVFLLDMGRPVRILDLAHRFVRAHGLEPEKDVAIVITGPRPGEKLHEELLHDTEQLRPTPHPGVSRLACRPPPPDRMERLVAMFDRLRHGHEGFPWQFADRDELRTVLRQAIEQVARRGVVGA